jgi:hypothetical protein
VVLYCLQRPILYQQRGGVLLAELPQCHSSHSATLTSVGSRTKHIWQPGGHLLISLLISF